MFLSFFCLFNLRIEDLFIPLPFSYKIPSPTMADKGRVLYIYALPCFDTSPVLPDALDYQLVIILLCSLQADKMKKP